MTKHAVLFREDKNTKLTTLYKIIAKIVSFSGHNFGLAKNGIYGDIKGGCHEMWIVSSWIEHERKS